MGWADFNERSQHVITWSRFCKMKPIRAPTGYRAKRSQTGQRADATLSQGERGAAISTERTQCATRPPRATSDPEWQKSDLERLGDAGSAAESSTASSV